MGKPFTRLYCHLVWATWNRTPLIELAWEERLFGCFGATCLELQSQLIQAGGVEDHVHLLVQAPPTLCVSDLVKRLKGASSHFVSHEVRGENEFKWQGYYGAFSVSGSSLRRVTDYIANQKTRHAQNRLWKEAEEAWIGDIG